MVLGDNEQTSREAWADNHLGDRASLDLIGQQEDLARAILALGKPTVVVLLNGRPLSVNYLAGNAPALLEGWYLGQETGHGVADVLFGRVNPGGKLPVSIARNVGQLPVFYNRKPTARRGYLFDSNQPLYPFGFGLSYTTFDISAPRLAQATIGAGDNVRVEVDVANTGRRAGDEVVQLYVRDDAASVTRPLLELKRFQRVTLRSGRAADPGLRADARRPVAVEHADAPGRRAGHLHDFRGTQLGPAAERDPDGTVTTIAFRIGIGRGRGRRRELPAPICCLRPCTEFGNMTIVIYDCGRTS